ncbi:MAG: hypothetical protein ACK476_10975 [Fluviicola sp.]
MRIPFEHFSDQAKVWVYQADRFLSETEVAWVNEQLEAFIPTWNAHGAKLNAAFEVISSCFVCLSVEEDEASASGCSIDSSVRIIKQIEKELGCSFFNRLKMLVEEENELKYVPFHTLSDMKNVNVFNNNVQFLKDLRSNWRIPVEKYAELAF